MSSVDRAYGLIKQVMLMGEQFEAINRKIAGLAGELRTLGASHQRVAERVAEIEGFLRAATGSPFGQRPRLHHDGR